MITNKNSMTTQITTLSEKSLPDSFIISTLKEKAAERIDVDFDFLSRLNDLRRTVSQQVRYTITLFPEYTPHDEEFHLKRLFHIADSILGKELIAKLNSSELLILSLALYGHDWGMAVSEQEKHYITTGRKISCEEKISSLNNEHETFKDFCYDRGISDPENISLENWQDYVRKTHAFRSGMRLRSFFEKDGNGIGEAAARASEGHWLDFAMLEDYQKYPIDYSVLRESINLRAIAIYVRLTDLFDIGDDRTPYVIWKYVAPGNTQSKFEWEKHRCISPITITNYQGGRIIKIDGSTDNNDVYAAILDMKSYCDTQLRRSNDLIAYMNEPRLKLDIFHCEWRINAIGFTPSQIRFEFDRNKMFEILGHNIYNDDPYVFLRELLQNSIDAIKVRRALLSKRNVTFPGLIEINIAKSSTGNIVVKWKDNGTGMDEYIIKNYLSVAGKSYYRSEDFSKLNLRVDPISKFGVGMLSCFMLTRSLTIETKRDSYLNGDKPSPCFFIKIVDKEKEFRIEQTSKELNDIGTLITLEIQNDLLKKILGPNAVEKFDITKYIADIAGFVEFPIRINQYGNIREVRSAYDPEFSSEIIKLNPSLMMSDLFQLHSINKAKKYVSFEHITCESLSLTNIEGGLTFVKFSNDVIEIKDANHSYPPYDFDFYIVNGNTTKIVNINLINHTIVEDEMTNVTSSKISKWLRSHSLYSNGILISNASPPEWTTKHYDHSYLFDYFYNPKISINYLHSTLDDKISLSRNELISKSPSSNWNHSIYEALLRYLTIPFKSIISALPLRERCLAIGKFMQEYRLLDDDVIAFFDVEIVPIPILTRAGKLQFKLLNELDSQIYLTDGKINRAIKESFYAKTEKVIKKIKKFLPSYDTVCIYERTFSVEAKLFLSTYLKLVQKIIEKKYTHTEISFYKPEGSSGIILSTNIMTRKQEDETIFDYKNFSYKSLSQPNRNYIVKQVSQYLDKLGTLDIIKFPIEFDSYLLYGQQALNSNHIICDYVFTNIFLLKQSNSLSEIDRGKLVSLIGKTPFSSSYYYSQNNLEDVEEGILALLQHIEKCSSVKLLDKGFTSAADLYVPDSIILSGKKINLPGYKFEQYL